MFSSRLLGSSVSFTTVLRYDAMVDTIQTNPGKPRVTIPIHIKSLYVNIVSLLRFSRNLWFRKVEVEGMLFILWVPSRDKRRKGWWVLDGGGGGDVVV